VDRQRRFQYLAEVTLKAAADGRGDVASVPVVFKMAGLHR
jgi:hypothetical protein